MPTVKQRRLGRDELAGRVNYSASLISMIESGHRSPSRDFAARCDEAFGTPGTFARLERRLRDVPFSSGFRPFEPYETAAVSLRLFEHTLIPGLLQTETYARAVLEAHPNTGADEVEERLAARMARQAVLSREDPPPPILWVLLDENVLVREVGSAEIMRDQLAHLAGLGHTRIAHIAGPQEVSTGLARYRGFIAAMEAHGLTPDPELIVTAKSFSIDEGMRCTQLLLQRDAGCTAVAAGNDMLAIGCYAALDEVALNCPADLSVVGFNDMPFIDRLRPPLTTIRFPHYQVGTEAAQLLLERIAGHTGPVKVLFLAPELVVRGSTGPPGGAA